MHVCKARGWSPRIVARRTRPALPLRRMGCSGGGGGESSAAAPGAVLLSGSARMALKTGAVNGRARVVRWPSVQQMSQMAGVFVMPRQ